MPVAVFSMEMGASQLAHADDRLGRPARPAQAAHRPPRPEDWDKLSAALGRLKEAPILIDETPALNAIEVRSRARRIMKQYGELGLVIVDYLQLMQASIAGREPRDRDLRDLARDEVAGEGAPGAGRRAVAAQPLARAAPEQAAGDVGSS